MGQRHIVITAGTPHVVLVLSPAEVRGLCIAGATGLDGSAEAHRSAILARFGGQASLDAAKRALDLLAEIREEIPPRAGSLR